MWITVAILDCYRCRDYRHNLVLWITTAILELKQLKMLFPRTVSIRELIHATKALIRRTAGRSGFIRSIPAFQRGPCQFVTRRRIFQVSAVSSLCVGERPTQQVTGIWARFLHKKATTC